MFNISHKQNIYSATKGILTNDISLDTRVSTDIIQSVYQNKNFTKNKNHKNIFLANTIFFV